MVDQGRGSKICLILFLYAGVLWTLWNTSKDAVFNNQILNSPSTVIHKNRRQLLKPKNLEMADELLEKLVQGEK